MGPISRLSGRQTDPYQAWREKLEKRADEKERAQRTDEKHQGLQGVKGEDGEKEAGSGKEAKNTPVQRRRDEYVKKPELYQGSTDKVDREIEKLKERKKELEGQLRTEQDETKLQSLERELAQVERELSQKDNDGYRRQHTVVTKKI